MIFESYRFLDPLGRGSFGEVWRVEFLRVGNNLGRLFAVKCSYLSADHEAISYEMRHSVPILSLTHPHILQLFACEGFIEGRLLLVMELADGSLMERWRQCRASGSGLPLVELMLSVQQVAEALDCVHERGFVHGGINPGDVLLLNGHVKIADPSPPLLSAQAYARLQAANLSKALCMAPERKHGSNTCESDQYALAATYAWLRIGHPVLELDARPEELRSISSLSASEQEVLVKALSVEPDRRYPSCIAFADALRCALMNG
jgi:serine/threonine protein kinase